MSSRKESLYRKLFEYLKLKVNLTVSKFTSDYERAMRKAAKTIWPAVNLVGCYFHYCQAIKRKAHSFPEVSRALQTRNGYKIYKMYAKLPLLPLDKFADGLAAIDATEQRCGHRATFSSFRNYFDRFWVRKVRPENFVISSETHRTNNYLESFNARLSRQIRSQPNIYLWIGEFQFKKIFKVD